MVQSYGLFLMALANLIYVAKEVEENTARIQKMRDENRDEYDIRKQVKFSSSNTRNMTMYMQEEVLEESRMMIPDSGRRLDEALQKLVNLLV